MSNIASILVAVSLCVISGCTNYLYQADMQGKDAYGKDRQFTLYWTKTDPLIGEAKASPAVLLTECSNTKIDFSDQPNGVVFRGIPGYDRQPGETSSISQDTVCGKFISDMTLVDAKAGPLSVQIICMPIEDNEFALQPRNYLAARSEPYLFQVEEKVKKWSLTGVTLEAPVVTKCRDAK